jgi:hypothetical protein
VVLKNLVDSLLIHIPAWSANDVPKETTSASNRFIDGIPTGRDFEITRFPHVANATLYFSRL